MNYKLRQGCRLESLYIDYSKKGYRLPTEAEWEYACRGGTTYTYWWGYGYLMCDSTSWYIGNSHYATHPVAQKEKNPYGLYDITGNVWEWCNDWYASYDSAAQVDPHGKDTVGAMGKVIRGGSWYFDYDALGSAERYSWGPNGGSNDLGFRVVLPK